MATTYTFGVNTETKTLCYDNGGGPVSNADLPRFFFGDIPHFTLKFPASTFSEGDVLVAAIDTDKNFIDTTAMSVLEHTITAEEASTQIVEIDMQTRTQRFVDCANNRPFEVKVFFELKRHFETEEEVVNGEGETETVTTQTDILLCDTFAYAKATVAQYGDPLVILPSQYYYTKEQINEKADGMEEIKQDAIDAKDAAETAQGKAEDARDDAQTAKEGSEDAAILSQSYAKGGTNTRTGEDTDNSKYYKEQAASQASGASHSADNAAASATLSESYAKGGTNTRSGEDTDNSKYYKEQADSAKQAAADSASDASDAKTDAINAKNTAVNASQTAASETAAGISAQFSQALSNVNAAVTAAQTAATNAANSQTAVANQAVTVAANASAAAASSANSHVWSEGTDEQVAALGGEHSAKGWAQEAAQGGQWGNITGDISSQTDLMDKFDEYIPNDKKGAANGVAGLDANGLILGSELPLGSDATTGIKLNSSGKLAVVMATESEINSRTIGTSRPITPYRLNYAVTAALTDANKIQLTDAQKASAQDTLGAAPAALHLDAAPTTSTVGAFGQRAIVDATGKCYTCTAVTVDETDPENPVTTYTWTDDVNAKGGTFNGNVLIQGSNAGFNYRTGSGYVALYSCVIAGNGGSTNFNYSLLTGSSVQGRDHNQFVAGKNNNPIVGARITGGGADANHRKNIEELSWAGDHYITGGHQQHITEIPAATTAYTLAEGVFKHTPDAASTFTAPTVTDETRTHEIILYVDFTNVQTISFEDANGTSIPIKDSPVISAGDQYAFLMQYVFGAWQIFPVKL